MECLVHRAVAITPHQVISQFRPVGTVTDSLFRAVASWRVSVVCVNINLQGEILELQENVKDLPMKVSEFAS